MDITNMGFEQLVAAKTAWISQQGACELRESEAAGIAPQCSGACPCAACLALDVLINDASEAIAAL